MDSGNEILSQKISNNLIQFINKYIQDNLDEVVIDEELLSNIQDICELIYSYSNIKVYLEDILNKQNLLSMATIFLPLVSDSDIKYHKNSADFESIVRQIALIAEDNLDNDNAEFYHEISAILAKYPS